MKARTNGEEQEQTMNDNRIDILAWLLIVCLALALFGHFLATCAGLG